MSVFFSSPTPRTSSNHDKDIYNFIISYCNYFITHATNRKTSPARLDDIASVEIRTKGEKNTSMKYKAKSLVPYFETAPCQVTKIASKATLVIEHKNQTIRSAHQSMVRGTYMTSPNVESIRVFRK